MGRTFPPASLEKLHLVLVSCGCGPRGKCTEVASLAGLRILVQGVESVLAGRQFADHRRSLDRRLVLANGSRLSCGRARQLQALTGRQPTRGWTLARTPTLM